MLNQYGNILFSYSYNIKCSFNTNLDSFKMYNGDNAPTHFFGNLVKDFFNYLSIMKSINTLIPPQKIKQICQSPV